MLSTVYPGYRAGAVFWPMDEGLGIRPLPFSIPISGHQPGEGRVDLSQRHTVEQECGREMLTSAEERGVSWWWSQQAVTGR